MAPGPHSGLVLVCPRVYPRGAPSASTMSRTQIQIILERNESFRISRTSPNDSTRPVPFTSDQALRQSSRSRRSTIAAAHGVCGTRCAVVPAELLIPCPSSTPYSSEAPGPMPAAS